MVIPKYQPIFLLVMVVFVRIFTDNSITSLCRVRETLPIEKEIKWQLLRTKTSFVYRSQVCHERTTIIRFRFLGFLFVRSWRIHMCILQNWVWILYLLLRVDLEATFSICFCKYDRNIVVSDYIPAISCLRKQLISLLVRGSFERGTTRLRPLGSVFALRKLSLAF